MKVRFLRRKTYPHDTGPKRRVGEIVDFPDDKHGRALLKQWSGAGIVEAVKPPPPPAKNKGGDKPPVKDPPEGDKQSE